MQFPVQRVHAFHAPNSPRIFTPTCSNTGLDFNQSRAAQFQRDGGCELLLRFRFEAHLMGGRRPSFLPIHQSCIQQLHCPSLPHANIPAPIPPLFPPPPRHREDLQPQPRWWRRRRQQDSSALSKMHKDHGKRAFASWYTAPIFSSGSAALHGLLLVVFNFIKVKDRGFVVQIPHIAQIVISGKRVQTHALLCSSHPEIEPLRLQYLGIAVP